MLRRSNAAEANKPILFRELNDIDIYVEDTERGADKLYRIIFKRLLRDGIKIKKVFSSGNKTKLLENVEKFKGEPSRQRLFVTDADIQLIQGEIKPGFKKDRNLLVLDRYCIENYLVEHSAILDYLDEESTTLERDTLEEFLRYDEWKRDNADALYKLFCCFAVLYEEGEKTISHGYKKFVDDGSGIVSKEKVDEFVKGASSSKADIYLKTASEMTNDDKLKFVSGKDFLFPLIHMRIKQVEKIYDGGIKLKQKLARRADLSAIADLLGASDYI